jgi:hypothetical protein
MTFTLRENLETAVGVEKETGVRTAPASENVSPLLETATRQRSGDHDWNTTFWMAVICKVLSQVAFNESDYQSKPRLQSLHRVTVYYWSGVPLLNMLEVDISLQSPGFIPH